MARDLVARVRRDLLQQRMVEHGERVVVAVSGGPDSTALLHILARLSEELRLSLVAAHLDHGLRDTQAERRWVAELADRVGVPLRLARLPRGALRQRPGGLEAAARHARYAFLRRVAREERADRIAVGHTADDQAETVLMRLLRGAGPAGLAGMAARRADGVIRPLLGVWRAEIEAYLSENGLRPAQDPTNVQPFFFRNRVRLQVLPALSRLNPGLPRHLVQLATLLRDDEALLDALAAGAWQELVEQGSEAGEDKVCLPLDGLGALPAALQRRVVRHGFARLAPGALPFEHVERLLAAARGESAEASLDLPGGVTARVGAGQLCLERRGLAAGRGVPGGAGQGPWPVAVPGRTEVPALGVVVVAELAGGAGEGGRGGGSQVPLPQGVYPPWVGQSLCLSLEEVQGELCIRRRQPGDRIRPPGLDGRKKLADLFIDEKVPRPLRERWPLLADAAGVLWVPGLRADARAVRRGGRGVWITVLPAAQGEGEETEGGGDRTNRGVRSSAL